ncbi:hypothetical protein BIW11_02762 [Tropilaelaps mercedesae]|uniref:Uncharacterized protein n=1 Tax=Tropilaelaps mercedesae TaxID=418985 RepID=A0A1V9XXX4_9ACAR|nr:hypothetical protein BIW11_02762 [Tropilaelaps mercedesae]
MDGVLRIVRRLEQSTERGCSICGGSGSKQVKRRMVLVELRARLIRYDANDYTRDLGTLKTHSAICASRHYVDAERYAVLTPGVRCIV